MYSTFSVFYISCLVFLLGCGSSSSPKIENNNVVETPTLIDDIVEETNIETVKDISCNNIVKLNFVSATASDELTNFNASNTFDSNFMAESRWSTSKNNQALILTLGTPALIKGISITWLNNDNRSYSYDVEISKDNNTWLPVLSAELSNASSTRAKYMEISENTARYIKIIPNGNNLDDNNHIVEVEAFGCMTDISTSIELIDWYLSIPVDEKLYSKAQSIKELTLSNDYFNAQFYFMNHEGGLVFRAPIEGAKTSSNTSYTRTELREMLRQGNTSISTKGINKNNWVLSSAPIEEQNLAGGIDGELIAELAVNHVTSTGDRSQVGRVIIGQIHANDDEPIRVYYRKLPENDKGAIYLAHEILGGDDIYYEIIGTRAQSAENPDNGIALNERFGYNISVNGNLLTFILFRAGLENLTTTIDMSDSGYNLGGQYMYFKAGVYNQNNTGDAKDYVQATFYYIHNMH